MSCEYCDDDKYTRDEFVELFEEFIEGMGGKTSDKYTAGHNDGMNRAVQILENINHPLVDEVRKVCINVEDKDGCVLTLTQFQAEGNNPQCVVTKLLNLPTAQRVVDAICEKIIYEIRKD